MTRRRIASFGRRTALVAAVLMWAVAPPARAHAPWSAKAWGNNNVGQLGNGTRQAPEKCVAENAAGDPCDPSPMAVSKLSGLTAVAGGGQLESSDFALALLENGTVQAWGSNFNGQLGNGTTEGSDAPAAVKGLTAVKAIAAGGEFGLALLEDGTVSAWGSNGSGQLGTGNTTNSTTPVAVCAVGETAPCAKDLEGVTAVAAGGNFALAVLSNGTVVAWGDGSEGRLGDGTTTSSTVPVGVCAAGTTGACPTGPFLSGVTAVSADATDGLARLNNGTAVAWGEGLFGQLGNGGTAEANSPVVVKEKNAKGELVPLEGVSAVSAGGSLNGTGDPQMVALLSNGTVRSWGFNEDGQLGNGSFTGPETCTSGTTKPACSTTAIAVSGLTGVTAVAARGGFTLALLSSGTIESWGKNGNAELGTGSITGPEPCGTPFAEVCSTKPVAVIDTPDTKGIGAGPLFGLALGPPPTVTAVTFPGRKHGHARGPSKGGTTVTVRGLDFAGVSAVKFGGVEAASFTVSSATSITAVSPPHAKGAVDVTVTNVWGTSATSEADHFNYRRR